jgi:hypothetical protein
MLRSTAGVIGCPLSIRRPVIFNLSPRYSNRTSSGWGTAPVASSQPSSSVGWRSMLPFGTANRYNKRNTKRNI